MIIGINGRVGSGKDTVGRIIQYLIRDTQGDHFSQNVKLEETFKLTVSDPFHSGWEIKKFAAKLKQIASLLTGIPVEKFEDQEFKKEFVEAYDLYTVYRYNHKDFGNDKEYETYTDKKSAEAFIKFVLAKHPYYKHEDFFVKESRMTVREFLQRLGTEGIRNAIHHDAWVIALFADYEYHSAGMCSGGPERHVKNCLPNWIITDCRFPNEAQAIKDKGGIVIRVTRPGENLADLHPSETSLDNWTFDYVLDNSTTIANLRDNVAFFLHKHNLL